MRAQFFIVTIVLVMLIISLIALNLYSVKINIDNQNFENEEIVRSTLKQISDSFREWLPYNHRKVIEINSYKKETKTIYLKINLNTKAYPQSLQLRDENGNNVPFGVLLDEYNNGTLFFLGRLNYGKQNYYLYYNEFPESMITAKREHLVKYSETNSEIVIHTGNYDALFNKTSGEIVEINSSENNRMVLNTSDIINCSTSLYRISDANTLNISVNDKGYFLEINIKGGRTINESFDIKYIFLPDMIFENKKLYVGSDINCGWMHSLAYNTTMLTNNETGGNVITLFGDDSLNIRYGNGYVNLDSRQVNIVFSNLLKKGVYENNITIIPLTNRVYRDVLPTIKTKDEDLNNEFKSIMNIFENFFSDMNVIVNYNKSISIDDLYLNGEQGFWILKTDVLVDNVSRYGYETNKNSEISNFLNNTLINHTIYFVNPLGVPFNISFLMIGSLSGVLKYPNNTTEEYNPLPPTINVNSYLRGTYELNVYGDGSFKVNTTLPYIAAKLPVAIDNGSEMELITKLLKLKVDNGSGEIYDLNNNLLFNFTGELNLNTSPCIDWCKYIIKANKTIINGTDAYVGNNHPFIPLLKSVNSGFLHNGITKTYNKSDLMYKNNVVNNSVLTFNFSNMNVYLNGKEWINNIKICNTTTCALSYDTELYQNSSSEIVILTKTDIGIDCYFKFYPFLPVFSLLANTTNYMILFNTTNEIYIIDGKAYNISNNLIFIDKYNFTDYIGAGKNITTYLKLDTMKLIQNKSISIDNGSIRVKGYLPMDIWVSAIKPINVGANFYTLDIAYNFISAEYQVNSTIGSK